MSFLDAQNLFDDIFELISLILDTQPVKGTPAECLSRVRTYADKCVLNIFLEICKEDYVAGDDAGSRSKVVHEICKKLGLIKMAIGDTPDEIYAEYISMAAGLSEDASL